MDLETLRTQLSEAHAARHQAMTTGRVTQLSFSVSGQQSVSRQFATVAELDTYISRLEMQISKLETGRSGRVARFIA